MKGKPETPRSCRRGLAVIVALSGFLLCLGVVDLLIGKVGPGSAVLFGGVAGLCMARVHYRDGRRRGLLGAPDEDGNDTR